MALSGIRKVLLAPALIVSSMLSFQVEAMGEMHKCVDETGHTIYSDYPCIKTKVQSMDIMVAPADEDSARRLRNKHGNNASSSNSRRSSNSDSTKKSSPKKKDPSCSYYKSQMSSLQNSLRSGYTPSQGERLKQSLKNYREKYRKGCK